MSEFSPTPSQKEAVETRGGAVLVSAAAGSGKTRVLTQRLMSYLTDKNDPKDIDSFLVITFTRAAAAELRSRIMDGIGRALAEDPENRRLRRQSALCQRAQIGTIHAFCQSVLRENCHLIGLPPDFRVADDDRAAAMKQSAMERVMDARYEDMDAHPGFALLCDTVGAGRDDARLSALALNLHEKMQCHARPEKWAREQAEALKLTGVADAGQTPWGRELMCAAGDTAEYWAGEMEKLVSDMSGDAKMAAAYAASFADTAAALRDFRRALNETWDRAREFSAIPFPRLGSLRDPADPELAERVKARREECKKAAKSMGEQFAQPSEKLLRELAASAPAMEALLELVTDFDRAYSADKRRAGLVDFSDLEHLTAQLLTDEDGAPTELSREIAERYTEIMVDEYQDVSEVQDAIFRAVSRDGKNLFMVGDVKQAIYRFRLADPAIFIQKYNSFRPAADAAPGEPRLVLLRENFRSRREIIDGANSVFSSCMSRALGEVTYDDGAALRQGAKYEGEVPVPEITLIDTAADPGDDEAPDKVRAEANYAAGMIRKLINSGAQVEENGAARPMDYGDVCILLRSANAVGGVYRRALEEQGIPVSSGQGGGFFTSVEVSSVMSILAVTDNPRQDVPLIAALRSPAFGFTPDQLTEIRASDRDADFYTALVKAAETDQKCSEFLQKLSEFRKAAPDMELGEFVWHVYNQLDLMALCSAMPDGEARRQNLMLLLEYARKYEATGYRGVHRFTEWMRRLADRGEEPGAADSGENGVRIMSIHKSKGLEFPAVFLCDTGRQFNKQDSRDTVLVHPQLGLGPKVTDLERHVEYPSLARLAIKRRAERETLSEEMRLLYVAVTRARERLFITAGMKDPQTKLEKLCAAVSNPMPAEVLAAASSPAQWLIYAAMAGKGEIKLTVAGTEEDSAAAEPSETDSAGETDDAARTELGRRLSFRYPREAAVEMPAKVTATELKSRLSPSDEEAAPMLPERRGEFREPDFMREDKPLTGARRGTATHAALQYMDFSAAAGPGGAASEVEKLRRAGLLSDAEAQSVDVGALERLVESETGRGIMGAKKLEREFRFSVLLPAEEFFPGGEGEETLLQGAVDCWYDTPEGLVIVDYKTDRVTEKTVDERAEFYAPQLRAYALALTAVTGRPVMRTVLYFLAVGKAVITGKNP
jgi:ATP-dependent helicase/nuclease subunit A